MSSGNTEGTGAAESNTVTTLTQGTTDSSSKAKAKKQPKEKKNKPPQGPGKQKKKQSKEGIEFKKEEDFSNWYQDVIKKSEMIEYYDISGCYIFRPWSFSIWEFIKEFVDAEIKKLGVLNSYFPLFVSKDALEIEKDHIQGFAPEVAWVTKAGDSELPKHIAVRPTSETIMYPAFKKWIRSHRDLPLKVNQWNNVVRWEFKDPVPFLRSREFLWQEGHTAFASKEEADEEVLQILDIYRRVYEELLAVPVVPGKKTEAEKFAGGLYTTTVEGYIPTNGRAIQGATSHCLGTNFSKMFKIQYESETGDKTKKLVWQNSWGITTRTIGVMIMQHGDDQGLILPPRVSPVQVVIVPLYYQDMSPDVLNQTADELGKSLREKGVRVEVDKRDFKNPGWKFNMWEMKGVPLRIEIGPSEIQNNTVVIARRDIADKKQKKITVQINAVSDLVPQLLNDVQKSLLENAKQRLDSNIVQITEWKQFVPSLNEKRLVLAPFCEEVDCEEQLKEKSKKESESLPSSKLTGSAKSLCIPFKQPNLPSNTICFCCDKKAVSWTLFGRSY